MEDFLTELLAPLSKTSFVRASADGSADVGVAAIREARSAIRARHRRLTDAQIEFVLDRAINEFALDPYLDESLEAVVTRKADAYVETLPAPLGRAGAVRFWDALVEARGGQ